LSMVKAQDRERIFICLVKENGGKLLSFQPASIGFCLMVCCEKMKAYSLMTELPVCHYSKASMVILSISVEGKLIHYT
jgi:hypothetical protein